MPYLKEGSITCRIVVWNTGGIDNPEYIEDVIEFKPKWRKNGSYSSDTQRNMDSLFEAIDSGKRVEFIKAP
jgi:hypothetical protein